jgi:hypothetical protein
MNARQEIIEHVEDREVEFISIVYTGMGGEYS